jgi:hypothetical protein
MSIAGQLDMKSNKIVNVLNPTAAQDVATKSYVDSSPGTNVKFAQSSGNSLITNTLFNTFEVIMTVTDNFPSGVYLVQAQFAWQCPVAVAVQAAVSLNGTILVPSVLYSADTADPGTAGRTMNTSGYFQFITSGVQSFDCQWNCSGAVNVTSVGEHSLNVVRIGPNGM